MLVFPSATDFNPRTRVGCDVPSHHSSAPIASFQSTHPRGVRHLKGKCSEPNCPFQSTHPRGVRRLCRSANSGTLDFNPRTRVGCDARVGCETMPPFAFQSTHPRGVRPTQVDHIIPHKGFQSTHPRGVRLISASTFCASDFISIHAPAWGATLNTRRAKSLSPFQSTHPRGVRPCYIDPLCDAHRTFQSTHPRGVRQIVSSIIPVTVMISIHAPAWGATGIFTRKRDTIKFQSTHPRGVRLSAVLCYT